MDKIKIRSSTTIERPEINEWFKMLKVSCRYTDTEFNEHISYLKRNWNELKSDFLKQNTKKWVE